MMWLDLATKPAAPKARSMFGRLVVAVFFVLSAYVEYQPPTKAIRDQVTQVEIEVRPSPALVPPESPVSGIAGGAGSGFLQGAAMSVLGGTAVCISGDPYACAFGLALGIALSPIAALVGAIVGAVKAHTDEDVAATDLRYTVTARAVDMRQRMLDCLVKSSSRVKMKTFRINGDTTGVQLNIKNADGRLELEIVDLRFGKRGWIEPDIFLSIVVHGRLRVLSSGKEIYWRKWQYLGGIQPYFSSADTKDRVVTTKTISRNFEIELKTACRMLATKIIDDLFISSEPEKGGSSWDGSGPETRTIDAMEIEE